MCPHVYLTILLAAVLHCCSHVPMTHGLPLQVMAQHGGKEFLAALDDFNVISNHGATTHRLWRDHKGIARQVMLGK